MKKLFFLFIILASIALIDAFEPNFVTFPTISPDGRNITFIYRSDLWEVPFTGGVARRLTASNSDVGRPMYSSDGLWIYFVSDREGRFKLYRIPAVGGQAELLSNEYFRIRDVYSNEQSILGIVSYPGEQSIFVRFDVGTKRFTEISGFAGETATISNDGKSIVFNRFEDTDRPAYQGSISGELWLYEIEKEEFTKLSQGDFTYSYPRFSRVHPNRIYFVNSDGKDFQLFYMDGFDYSTKTQLTFFDDWSVRNISVSHNTDRIVFELFDEIWRFDPETELSEKVSITILEDNLPYTTVYNKFDSELTNFTVSPNGELLVFSHKYDLFAVPVSGGNVRQLTFDQKGIFQIVILDDNETIYFRALERGIPRLFKTNIKDHILTNSREATLVDWSKDKYILSISRNDQKDIYILFNNNESRHKLAFLAQNEQITELFPNERVLTRPAKTKDNAKQFYISSDDIDEVKFLKINDIRANTIEEIFVSSDLGSLLLNDDDTHLFLSSWGDIKIVNLVNDRQVQDDNWEKIVPGSSMPDTTPSREWDINRDNFSSRIRNVVSESGWVNPLYATNDSTLVYVNWTMATLNSINFDGSDKTEILKFGENYTFPDFELSPDRTHFYYVQDDNLHKFNMTTEQSEGISFEYEYEYDILRLNQTVFEEVWGDFGHFFYDPDMHGQDWEALFEKFSPFTKNLLEVSHLAKVIDEMIGRVNASHTGYSARSESNDNTREIAFAGFVLDFRSILSEGINIKKIYFDSVLYQQYGIRENDVILAINGQNINSNTEITPLFVGKENQDISLRIRTPRGIVNAIVKGISWEDQWQMRYDDMVLNNIKSVREKTNGRIGYLHIQQMDWNSLNKFREDFFAVNFYTDAMIIDVRSNPGGRISDRLLEMISRKPYSYLSWRSDSAITSDPISYQKPLVVLIDENSYSDAEVFGILFNDLNLGTIIGMPTSGSVIGTTSSILIDGSEMRLPMMGLYRLNMENMENTGAKPDIEIPRLPSDIVKREDPQLEKAIEYLLERIAK